MTDSALARPGTQRRSPAAVRRPGPVAALVRRLPAALLLVAAALTFLAAARVPGVVAGIWWTLLPVDPSDPDRVVLAVTAAAIVGLAIGLLRGKRDAFLLAVASFSTAIVAQGWLLAHPVGGIVAGACLAILAADRRRYVVRAPRAADRLLLSLVGLAALVAVTGVAIGVADRRLHAGAGVDVLLALQGVTAIVSFSSMRAMAPVASGLLLVVIVVAARAAIAVGTLGILRPQAPARRPPSGRARAILARHARGGLVPFLLGPEVSAFEPPGVDAVVMYALDGRWAVALGDPVGTADGARCAWPAFTAWCRERDLVPCAYQATEGGAAAAGGERAFRVGLEAVVDLATFDLAGSRRANLRHTVTRARRGGIAATWWPDGIPLDRVDLRGALVDVDAAWTASRAGPALGFTVGRFDPDELARTPVAVASKEDGEVVAFATFRPTGDGGWVLELMRRKPGSVPGAFELCIVEAAIALRGTGARTLSLGLAPLAGLDATRGPLEERLLAVAARLGRPVYDVSGLEFFKRKFDPRWEPRLVVVRDRADVLGLSLALLRLHLGRSGILGGLVAMLPRPGLAGRSGTPTSSR